ncbi:zinc dependent phospholipase C family protein [Roseburia hominis]
MPAQYAHDRFGALTARQLTGDLKEIVRKYYPQFRIGLQGPDIFFFYRAYKDNRVVRYGNHLHHVSALPFFRHARKVAAKYGRDSHQYAYLLGFICHYILDSECHPYVAEMMEKTGVAHLEIEGEFEKFLLYMDGKNAVSYPLARLIPTDDDTVEAIRPFYNDIHPKIVKRSLKDMKLVRRVFRAPCPVKQWFLNTAMKIVGKYDTYKGLMLQRKDNHKCDEAVSGLFDRLVNAVPVAARMIASFDESLQTGKDLDERFDRTFE